MRVHRSLSVASLVAALACGRTGLEGDPLDVGGTSGAFTGGSAGRGAGGTLTGAGGDGAGGSPSGGVGGGEFGGSAGLPGTGGSVGGSETGSGGAQGGAGAVGGDGGVGASGGDSGATGGQMTGGTGGVSGMAGMAGMAGMPPLGCGDGVVDPDEACDGGSDPSPPAFELRQGGLRYEVVPVVGPDSPTEFYDYRSASSHTGFEGVGASRIYLYRWTVEQAMSLVFHAGIDENETGLSQPESHIIFEVSGLPSTGVVVLSDERMELARTSGTAAGAEWQFRRNTDGGIVGGLPFPGTWHLTVSVEFIEGFVEWTFLSGTGLPDESVSVSHVLDMTQPIEIVASGVPGSCRADCTVPVCGDGRLDPGEVCDDGNSVSGDGCTSCLPEF